MKRLKSIQLALYAILPAMMLLFVSCEKTPIDDNPQADEGLQTLTIPSLSKETKATASTTGSTIKGSWVVGDELLITGGNLVESDQAIFVIKSAGDIDTDGTALFTAKDNSTPYVDPESETDVTVLHLSGTVPTKGENNIVVKSDASHIPFSLEYTGTLSDLLTSGGFAHQLPYLKLDATFASVPTAPKMQVQLADENSDVFTYNLDLSDVISGSQLSYPCFFALFNNDYTYTDISVTTFDGTTELSSSSKTLSNDDIKEGSLFKFTDAIVLTAGQLYPKLREVYGDDYETTLTDLTITGEMNEYDFVILKGISSLKNVNLRNVKVVDEITITFDGESETAQDGDAIPAWGFGDYDGTSMNLETIILPSTITTIGQSAFVNMPNLKSIEFPASVRTVERWIAEGSSNLKTIILNEGLTTLMPSAFYGCGVESITIPSTITEISDWMFEDCNNLANISFAPNSQLNTIGDAVFKNCSQLPSIEFPASVRTIGRWVAEGCSNLETITLNEGLTTLMPSAFYGCGVESITIPSTVTEISDYAFENCENLKNLTFAPNSQLTRIGEEAFMNCYALLSVDIPEGVQELAGWAFYYCEKLSSVKLPSSLKTIGRSAFEYCAALTEITIPAGVTNIDNSAFSYCDVLNKVTVLATTPPSLDDTPAYNQDYHFTKDVWVSPIEAKLYVPSGTLAAYNASAWNNPSFFASIIEIGSDPAELVLGYWEATALSGKYNGMDLSLDVLKMLGIDPVAFKFNSDGTGESPFSTDSATWAISGNELTITASDIPATLTIDAISATEMTLSSVSLTLGALGTATDVNITLVKVPQP